MSNLDKALSRSRRLLGNHILHRECLSYITDQRIDDCLVSLRYNRRAMFAFMSSASLSCLLSPQTRQDDSGDHLYSNFAMQPTLGLVP